MDFKYKTCKKIAELTQVINILFVQNHEKDLLLNEFKSLTEQFEIECTKKLENAITINSGISETDRQLIAKDLEKRFFAEENQIRNHYELSINNLKSQISKNLNELVKSEKSNCQLKNQFDELLVEKSKFETQSTDKIQTLIKEYQELNEKYLISEQNYQNIIKNKANKDNENKIKIEKLNNENIKLNKEISQIKEKSCSLENKCKELEMEIMSLNEDLVKFKQNLQRSISSNNVIQKPIRKDSLINEELNKELQRYKLELKNRDKNFNKMFTRNTLKTVEPFFDCQRLSQNFSENKNEFKVCLGQSKRQNNNVTLKIVSAQYDSRKPLPNICKE